MKGFGTVENKKTKRISARITMWFVVLGIVVIFLGGGGALSLNLVRAASTSSLLYAVVLALMLILAAASCAAVGIVLTRSINGELDHVVEDLKKISGEIETTSSQLRETSESLADGSTRQAAAIEQTSATMNETSSMVSSNAENTRQAAQLSQKAINAGSTGMHKMDNMVASMEELKNSSDMISKIIKTIEDIAFQTNLLAINATIEAAQAGEAGRGFGVVADEVRNLAKKSAKAANDTAEIINKNITLTNLVTQTSIEVARSLKEVNDDFGSLNQIIDEINAASDEQAKGIRQINDAMSDMEKITQYNAASAEQSAAAANGLTDETRNLRGQIDFVMRLIKKDAGSDEGAILKTPPMLSSAPARSLPAQRAAAPGASAVAAKRASSASSKASDLEKIIPLESDNDF